MSLSSEFSGQKLHYIIFLKNSGFIGVAKGHIYLHLPKPGINFTKELFFDIKMVYFHWKKKRPQAT